MTMAVENLCPIEDPIHDGVYYNEGLEEEIINSKFMQRLRRLHQLQTVYLVYPGADHTRFQHSIGVMHLAGMFAEHLLRDKPDKERYVEAVRIAGLLHDVGHGPFSHTFDEAVIHHEKRLADLGIHSHEDVGFLIVQKSEIGMILERKRLKEIVLDLLTPKGKESALQPLLKALRQTIHHSLYPADILDFIKRDAHFTGTKEYDTVNISRLIFCSQISDSDIALQERGLSVLNSYFYGRCQMFDNVYYHRTCRAIDHMVFDMLKKATKTLNLVDRIVSCYHSRFKGFLELDDFSLLFMLKGQENGDAKELADRILSRRNPWRRIGECTKSISDPTFAYLMSKNQSKYQEWINIEFKKKVKDAIGEEIPFFVDTPFIPTLPDSPYTEKGILKLISFRGKVYEKDISKILLDFQVQLKCTFRIYTIERIRDKYPELENIANNVLRDIVERRITPDISM